MKTNPLSLLAVVALTVVVPWSALANPYWGEFKKDNCSAIGKRQYSAILWNVSGSWEAACKKMPATINGRSLARPTRCFKKQVNGVPLNMWGYFDIPDTSCK
ncbi:hypothetical protein F0U59_17995 [Archangium gephyra]|nr:hypothetical protein F0U59_17995 [Archangium gephyra]